MRLRKKRAKLKKPSQTRSFPLDQTRLTLTLVGTIIDAGVNIPGLKAACGIADQIIDVAQKVRDNRKDCSILAQTTRDLVVTIIDAMKNRTADELDEGMKVDTDRFTAVLEEIRLGMIDMASRRLLKRIFHNDADKRKIREFEKRLDQAHKTFLVSRQIAAHWVQVEEVQMQSRNHDEAMEQLTDLERTLDVGFSGIKKILGCVKGPLGDHSVRVNYPGLLQLHIYTDRGSVSPRIKIDIDACFFFGLNFRDVLFL